MFNYSRKFPAVRLCKHKRWYSPNERRLAEELDVTANIVNNKVNNMLIWSLLPLGVDEWNHLDKMQNFKFDFLKNKF